jgi:hypothetical protein
VNIFTKNLSTDHLSHLQNVDAIPDAVISLAFWSAVVLHRFSMQQINQPHLSPFYPYKTVSAKGALSYQLAAARF